MTAPDASSQALATGAAPEPPARRPAEAAALVRLGHVAEPGKRYPGEPVTLHTRVEALAALPLGFGVRIGVPAGLKLDAASAAYAGAGEAQLVVARDDQYVLWRVQRPVRAGERFDYETKAHVAELRSNARLTSEAVAVVRLGQREHAQTAESADIAVSAKGAYLKYLPAIYADSDELMGRFIMLFESFWAPIEQQIEAGALYYDAGFTPSELLPWLATWVDLSLDERWPEEKRRELLRRAVSLYRKRGTRAGLQEYLEIYTGAQVKISESGADNFTLGPQARLGPGIALGTLNQPHTFTVTAFLPAGELAGASPEARARFEAERQRMIEAIIEAEKPAHTSYVLKLEAA
jgi:phage tail-like protein